MEGDLTQKCLWLKHFEILPDPRIDRKKQHLLMDILVLTLCAVICGATSWESIEDYGCKQEEWLRDIAEKIVDAKADYVLGLKGNQGKLLENVQLYMDTLHKGELEQVARDHNETIDKGHGRFEKHYCLVTECIDWLEEKTKWKGLRSIGMIIAERTIKGITAIERRYYISSLPAKADVFSQAIRQHWSVENQLHWVLDVVFNEDRQRMNTKHAAQNLAVIRQSALNLLRMDQTPKKMSLKRKQFCAALDKTYLQTLLSQCDNGNFNA